KTRPWLELLSERALPGDTCGGYFLSAFGVLPFVDPIRVVDSLGSEPGQGGSSDAAWLATSSLSDSTAVLATVADVTPHHFWMGRYQRPTRTRPPLHGCHPRRRAPAQGWSLWQPLAV